MAKRKKWQPSAETLPPEIYIDRLPEPLRALWGGRFGRQLTGGERRVHGEQVLAIFYWAPDALLYAMEIRPGMVKDAIERTKRGHRAAHAQVMIDIVTGVYEQVRARELEEGRKHKLSTLYQLVAKALNAGHPLDIGAHLEKRITANAVRAIIGNARKVMKRSSN